MNRLATWLTAQPRRFAGTMDFVYSLLLMAEEAGTIGFIRDHAQVRWYPPGCYVVEQGEAATELFMITSGRADTWQEQGPTRTRPAVKAPTRETGHLDSRRTV